MDSGKRLSVSHKPTQRSLLWLLQHGWPCGGLRLPASCRAGVMSHQLSHTLHYYCAVICWDNLLIALWMAVFVFVAKLDPPREANTFSHLRCSDFSRFCCCSHCTFSRSHTHVRRPSPPGSLLAPVKMDGACMWSWPTHAVVCSLLQHLLVFSSFQWKSPWPYL